MAAALLLLSIIYSTRTRLEGRVLSCLSIQFSSCLHASCPIQKITPSLPYWKQFCFITQRNSCKEKDKHCTDTNVYINRKVSLKQRRVGTASQESRRRQKRRRRERGIKAMPRQPSSYWESCMQTKSTWRTYWRKWVCNLYRAPPP